MNKKLKELWKSWDEPIFSFKDTLKFWLWFVIMEVFVLPLVSVIWNLIWR
jgi:hypothetical protein